MVDSANCVQVFERVYKKFFTYVQGLNIPQAGSVQNTMEEFVSQSDHRFIENWLVDSVASAHMTPYNRDLRDISSCAVMILLDVGSELQCTEQGTCTMNLTDNTGKTRAVLLPHVLLIPHLDRQLFSVLSFTSVNNNTVTFSHGKVELHYSGFTSDIGIPTRIKTTALPALTNQVEPISMTNLVSANSSPTGSGYLCSRWFTVNRMFTK